MKFAKASTRSIYAICLKQQTLLSKGCCWSYMYTYQVDVEIEYEENKQIVKDNGNNEVSELKNRHN